MSDQTKDTPEDRDLEAFLALAKSCLSAFPAHHPARGEAEAVLAGWPRDQRARSGRPAALPACADLPQTLAQALAPLLPRLGWTYGYPPDPRWPDLPSSIAFAQIVGPDGLCDNETVHLGLTLMRPRTYYPLHSHPAIELYLTLSGNARWRVAGQPFAVQPPGNLILHESGVPHAMETGEEPLLALYTWRGDLVTSPVYVED
jgi:mannose-6-phosphate isomerase-like protein (cupin superfamily)